MPGKKADLSTNNRPTEVAFFAVSEEQTTTKNSYIPRVYNNGNRTWETTVIPSQIWTNG